MSTPIGRPRTGSLRTSQPAPHGALVCGENILEQNDWQHGGTT